MKPDRAQDWDIARIYEAISSSDAVMPFEDAEIVMESFWTSQSRVLDGLTKLLHSWPDAFGVAPKFVEVSNEHAEGLDFGDRFEDFVSLEQLEANSEKRWEAFWLEGAKFEGIFQTTLQYDVPTKQWELRWMIEPAAGFWLDWDFRNNRVRLNLMCHGCGCARDRSEHSCNGLDCVASYNSSYIPSRYSDEAVFTISSFFEAHYAKHGWTWDGA